ERASVFCLLYDVDGGDALPSNLLFLNHRMFLKRSLIEGSTFTFKYVAPPAMAYNVWQNNATPERA
ncbi:MAG: hypothetical protein WEB33_05695, partial [Bacteroidota bacterium]